MFSIKSKILTTNIGTEYLIIILLNPGTILWRRGVWKASHCNSSFGSNMISIHEYGLCT